MPTTILQIHDEVKCSFKNLPPEIRRALYARSKIFNPANRFVPSVRLGRWDGKIAYFSMNGDTYINLLGPILEYLDSENYKVEVEDLRTYNRDFEFELINKDYLSKYVWPKTHAMDGQPIILRDHQVDVVNMFLKEYQGIAAMPTACGKTLCTAILSKKVEKYGRSIVIVPTKDLITQTESSYITLGLDVGVYYGDRKEFFKKHTICTWQSLESLRKTPIDIGLKIEMTIQQFIEDVKAIIVDECLATGTKISTPLGERSIESIQTGDEVYSYDEINGIFIIDEVIKLHKNLNARHNEKMFEIELENGSTIQITANHKVLTQRGWVKAINLLITDEIIHFA